MYPAKQTRILIRKQLELLPHIRFTSPPSEGGGGGIGGYATSDSRPWSSLSSASSPYGGSGGGGGGGNDGGLTDEQIDNLDQEFRQAVKSAGSLEFESKVGKGGGGEKERGGIESRGSRRGGVLFVLFYFICFIVCFYCFIFIVLFLLFYFYCFIFIVQAPL
jgi:hypothetical protein